jgi:hypothetical protein
MEAMRVWFLPLFVGTFPYALLPLGALALRRIIEIEKSLSSMNTSLLLSKWEASHFHSPRFSSSRSVAMGDFFERPRARKAGDGAAHRRCGELHPPIFLKSLAMLLKGEVGVALEL